MRVRRLVTDKNEEDADCLGVILEALKEKSASRAWDRVGC